MRKRQRPDRRPVAAIADDAEIRSCLAEREPALELLGPVPAQGRDQHRRKRNGSASAVGLRQLHELLAGILLQRGDDAKARGLEVDHIPPQREHLAESQACRRRIIVAVR